MYAKLVEGKLVKATNPLKVGKKTIYNPTEKVLRKYGYKPVVETPCPEDEEGYYYTSHWEETEDSIIRVWDKIEITTETEGV